MISQSSQDNEFFEKLKNEIIDLKTKKGNVNKFRNILISTFLKYLGFRDDKVQEVLDSKKMRGYTLGYLHELAIQTYWGRNKKILLKIEDFIKEPITDYVTGDKIKLKYDNIKSSLPILEELEIIEKYEEEYETYGQRKFVRLNNKYRTSILDFFSKLEAEIINKGMLFPIKYAPIGLQNVKIHKTTINIFGIITAILVFIPIFFLIGMLLSDFQKLLDYRSFYYFIIMNIFGNFKFLSQFTFYSCIIGLILHLSSSIISITDINYKNSTCIKIAFIIGLIAWILVFLYVPLFYFILEQVDVLFILLRYERIIIPPVGKVPYWVSIFGGLNITSAVICVVFGTVIFQKRENLELRISNKKHIKIGGILSSVSGTISLSFSLFNFVMSSDIHLLPAIITNVLGTLAIMGGFLIITEINEGSYLSLIAGVGLGASIFIPFPGFGFIFNTFIAPCLCIIGFLKARKEENLIKKPNNVGGILSFIGGSITFSLGLILFLHSATDSLFLLPSIVTNILGTLAIISGILMVKDKIAGSFLSIIVGIVLIAGTFTWLLFRFPLTSNILIDPCLCIIGGILTRKHKN